MFNSRPASGFAADLTAALTIYIASAAGFPVSTTQAASSSLIGAGAAKRMRGGVRACGHQPDYSVDNNYTSCRNDCGDNLSGNTN